MKRFIFFLAFLFLCLSVSPLVSPLAFAHPIDIASFVVPLEGVKTSDNKYRIEITSSATIPEITTTLKLQLTTPTDANPQIDFSNAKVPLSDYLSTHVLVSTDQGDCAWDHDHASETISEVDLSLVNLTGHILCPNEPKTLTIKDTSFIKEYPYQTNIVIVTKNDNVAVQKELNAVDTIVNYPDNSSSPTTNHSPFDSAQGKSPTTLNSGSLTAPFEKEFKNLLVGSLAGALLVAFLVGFLHSFEAGHSKTILASFMLRKDATIRQGLSYSLVFTITHVADILLFGLILLMLNSTIDIFSIINRLNRYAIFILLWTAIYMFVSNVWNLIKERQHKQQHEHGTEHHHDHGHSHEVSTSIPFRQQLWMGFLTGIAPCVMGWSIFFLILSTKTVWAVIPVILAFGGGIYVSLLITTVIVYKGKQTILNRVSFLSTYSPLISSTLLVIFSIVLLLQK